MANTTGLGDTIYAAVRKALEDKNGGSGGGGGGSSDLTTAQVTIVNNTLASFEGTMPMAFDGEVSGASSEFWVDVNETVVLTAILYKGHSAAIFRPEGTVAIEGSATDLGDGFIDVTGDCTITAS